MPAIWTEPKDWVYKDVFSAADANIQIRDNLLYLFQKPREYQMLSTAANLVVALTTAWAAVDDTQFTRTIVTTKDNQEVDLTLEGNGGLSVGAQYIVFDWLMDSTNYISTMTPTPLLYGTKMVYMLTAGVYYPVNFTKRVVIATAGAHTFKLRARIVTSNASLTLPTTALVVETGVQIV